MKIDPVRRFAKRLLPNKAQDRLRDLLRTKRAHIAAKRLSFLGSSAVSPPSPFPFMVSSSNPLEELGARYVPTKRIHNYLPYYWLHFQDIRFDVKNVLEIGVQSDHSIRMWEEFFPNATIYGLDIDPNCKQFEGGRRRILIGDQGDREFLDRVIRDADGAFDIVIDDGSHYVDDQLTTFEVVFPAMSDHGIYVIEDTGGCVGDFELATVRAMKSLVDSIMYWPRGFEASKWPHLTDFPAEAKWSDSNVVGIAFYRWIVFAMRGKNPQDNPYLSPLPRD